MTDDELPSDDALVGLALMRLSDQVIDRLARVSEVKDPLLVIDAKDSVADVLEIR